MLSGKTYELSADELRLIVEAQQLRLGYCNLPSIGRLIRDMTDHPIRIGLTVLEAAWLLSISELRVLHLIAADILEGADGIGLISIQSVRDIFPVDRLKPVRERALERLLAGEVRAYELPDPSGTHSPNEVIAATLQGALGARFPAALATINQVDVERRERSQRSTTATNGISTQFSPLFQMTREISYQTVS